METSFVGEIELGNRRKQLSTRTFGQVSVCGLGLGLLLISGLHLTSAPKTLLSRGLYEGAKEIVCVCVSVSERTNTWTCPPSLRKVVLPAFRR